MFGRKKTKPVKIHDLDELKPLVESGKPVLIDFFQFGCGPCKVMDGIVNELAADYGDTAHVVKVNVSDVRGAAQTFGVRSTPTFVLLGGAPTKKQSKKKRARTQEAPQGKKVTPRWRGAGLIKKDYLERVLESNGASRAEA
jgi:thioredoxin 1